MNFAKSLLLTTLVAAAAALAAPKASDPVEAVRLHDQELQEYLKRYQPTVKAQQDTLKQLINGMFSFPELGKRSLGKTWSTLKKVDQDTFIAVFKRAVEASSMKRLETYKADSTKYSAPTGAGETTVVTATVYRKGKGSTVVYKLFPHAGTWLAWDLVLDDVSSLRTYKDQFSTIIAKDGFPEVVNKLRAKSGN